MIDPEKKLWRMVRAALRRCWMYYGQNHRQAMDAARVNRTQWRCEKCEKLFGRKEVRRDHVVPCGSLRGVSDLVAFAKRLFYGKIQILCEADHAVKTKAEAAARRKKC